MEPVLFYCHTNSLNYPFHPHNSIHTWPKTRHVAGDIHALSIITDLHLLHHLFAAATATAAPFRPPHGGGFPSVFSIDRHTPRIQNLERKNSKTAVVEYSF
jgi:hypothetical protein